MRDKLIQMVGYVLLRPPIFLGHTLRRIVRLVTGCERRVPVVMVMAPFIAVFWFTSSMIGLRAGQYYSAGLDALLVVWVMTLVLSQLVEVCREIDDGASSEAVAISLTLARLVMWTCVQTVLVSIFMPGAVVAIFRWTDDSARDIVFAVGALLLWVQYGVALDFSGVGGKKIPSMVRSFVQSFAKPTLAREVA